MWYNVGLGRSVGTILSRLHTVFVGYVTFLSFVETFENCNSQTSNFFYETF
jgi:hypothetical protein